MNSEQLQALLRNAIYGAAASWMTSHGISNDLWQAAAGGIVAIGVVAWSYFSKSNKALVASGEKAKVALESPKP